jgi:uncharacterized protein
MHLTFSWCRSAIALGALLATAARGEPTPTRLPPPALEWHEWSPEVFAQAQRENKRVLLDLEAVWCHWCHVMDETTYGDRAVAAELRAHFILVRVDQDSRPDLASRYEDYGWPATIEFTADGAEVGKHRGYIPPDEMLSLLRDSATNETGKRAANVTPIKSATNTTWAAPRRNELTARWRAGYDHDKGGWGFRYKFLDWESVELASRLAARGDPAARQMAMETLRLQREHLLDPTWGGVYQYSVGSDWQEPHFEKLIQFQAENVRIFARAYTQFGDSADLKAAKAIHHYVRTFLTSPDGTVYVSQDADLVPGEHSAEFFRFDDQHRRALGVPRIDHHVYARENGWYIIALCDLSAATGEQDYVDEAVRAAQWIVDHRGLDGGGFRHDDKDTAGPYLGDTLAMGRAFLALYQVTQDRAWLDRAEAAMRFIHAHFTHEPAGFASSDTTRASELKPQPEFDENVSVARFSIALASITGRAEDAAIVPHALRWLLSDTVTDNRGGFIAGLLLAEEEARTDPFHVTIVAAKSDPPGKALLAAALQAPTTHKLVEWWDPSEPPPRGEAIYPTLGRAAAFLCANHACSTPLFTPTALTTRIAAALAN